MEPHQAPDIVAPSVWIGHAAYASRYGAQAIRHAMNIGGLKLLGDPDRSQGEFRRFAPVDVLRLAVLGRLVSYGFTAAEAASVLERTLDRFVFGIVAYREFPASLLPSHLLGFRIRVARAEGNIKAEAENHCGSEFKSHEHAVTLNVEWIARDVQARLDELTGAKRRAGPAAAPIKPVPPRRIHTPARALDGPLRGWPGSEGRHEKPVGADASKDGAQSPAPSFTTAAPCGERTAT